MIKLNSRGFTGLELVLTVIVIGLLVGVGFYVLQARQSAKSPKSDTVTTVDKGSQSQENSGEIATQDSEPTETQPPADCPVVAQQGVAIFIDINQDSPNYKCMQVSKGTVVAVNNNTEQRITVKLGDRTREISANSGSGFDGEVGSFLQVGKNTMDVSTYTADKDPVIWVTE